MPNYLRPVAHQGGISSYLTHTRRTVPSSEPGVDYYCPIGTPVRAVWSGKVVAVGGGVQPATGRYVTIDLDDGRRVRYLHLSKQHVRVGQRVTRGETIGLSGASGYGSEFFGASSAAKIPANTGGAHVHVTLWPGHWQRFGATTSGAIDIEKYIDHSAPAGSETKPADVQEEEDDDMKQPRVTQWYKSGKNTYTYIGYDTTSGFFHAFSAGAEKGAMDGGYTSAFAESFGSNGWSEITESHAKVIAAACAKVSGDPTTFTVHLID